MTVFDELIKLYVMFNNVPKIIGGNGKIYHQCPVISSYTIKTAINRNKSLKHNYNKYRQNLPLRYKLYKYNEY